MKKIVVRERNKVYYRILHLPIWIWVFFVLPGHLTSDLYVHGPDRRHWIWLALVTIVCIWRGLVGRLPGVEPRPYVTHYGADQPNLPYRVVCYTAAWIALLVPFILNFLGQVVAVTTGVWMIEDFHRWLYYPLALAIVGATFLNITPRARRSTRDEGIEKGWFYVGVWTVVPAQLTSWAMWRLGRYIGLAAPELNRVRLTTFVIVAVALCVITFREKLPRTQRYQTQNSE